MDKFEFAECVSQIDEKFIEEAQPPEENQINIRRHKTPWALIAACLFLVVAIPILVWNLKSNSGISNTDELTTPKTPNIVKKVALITDCGTIDDKGYNQACWEGTEQWCKENNAEYTYYQPYEDSTDARKEAVAQAVSEGANVIVMPGYLFGAVLYDIMELYPDVYFIASDVGLGDITLDYVDYREPLANTACMTFAEEQAGYLAGYAAVMEGYRNLAFYGGIVIPAVLRYSYGFVQGADAAAQELGVDIEIKYSYVGIFYCSSDEYIAKLANWYSEGTEIAFVVGEGLEKLATKPAKKYNAKVIACDVDYTHYDPCILTSATKNLKKSVYDMLTELENGNWENYGGKFTNLTLFEGNNVLLPTGSDSWRFENFTIAQYEELVQNLRNGTLTVSADYEYMPEVSSYTTVIAIG